MDVYRAIGVMSGTSLDGVDFVLARFAKINNFWTFEIEQSKTYDYSQEWKNILKNVNYNTPAFELMKLDQEYGVFLGNLTNDFLKNTNGRPMLVSSHGHTVFHLPSKGITTQIGNGNNIAAVTGLPVVYDMRSKDVALGGQGAPLVPCGDLHLFQQYKYCLNLGGFANISIKDAMGIVAFDICPVNIVINTLMADLDQEYDKDGMTGRSGEVEHELLNTLNEIAFYKEKGPKSLGKEWLEETFLPVLYLYNIPIEDKIRTIYAHIAEQIKRSVQDDNEKVLITGGGAFNTFLVSLLDARLKQKIVLPDKEIICFKEALVFAFLGVLRILGQNNVLSRVTGSSKDNCGGVHVV